MYIYIHIYISMGKRVLVCTRVNVIFYYVFLVRWVHVNTAQQTPPRCRPGPSPALPSNMSPFSPSSTSFSCKYSHPVVDTNLFRTRSVLLSGIDGNMMLPICSCISVHTQPSAFQHPRQLCRPVLQRWEQDKS